ncbi:hypothetical protein SK128_008330 [Halocaridina rubra]|uniref:Uncharacterized protein n=1 Tax=Halocaridina rubra TaxID=373956 RepID=A0AAN8WZW0_HALRR
MFPKIVIFVAVIVSCNTFSLNLEKLESSHENGTRKRSLPSQDYITGNEETPDGLAGADNEASNFIIPLSEEEDVTHNKIEHETNQDKTIYDRSYIDEKIAETSEQDNIINRNYWDMIRIPEIKTPANKSALAREESSVVAKHKSLLAKAYDEAVRNERLIDYSYEYPLIPDDTEEISRDFLPDKEKFTNIANMMEGIVRAMKSVQESESDRVISANKTHPLSATTEASTADDDSTTLNQREKSNLTPGRTSMTTIFLKENALIEREVMILQFFSIDMGNLHPKYKRVSTPPWAKATET